MKKHILICGEKGVGKSTLIRRLLEAADLTVGGFYTKMDESPKEVMHPIYIYPAKQPITERKRLQKNLIGRCGEFGRRKEIFPAVFDTLGREYLEDTQGCEVIVMDELGFMESEAYAFCSAVLRALDGDVPVIAAVKDKQGVPFLQQVRQHPQAEVFAINAENREELFARLLPLVKSRKCSE